MKKLAIHIPKKEVFQFCSRWKIEELSFFGSVVTGSFRKDSDIDVLVSYKPGSRWTLFDHEIMEEELRKILGRKVDLVTKSALKSSRNWIRRDSILNSAVKYYES